MMTTRIGRLTVESCVVNPSRAGRALTLSGWLTGSSLEELRAQVQQAWGYHFNRDEPVVPVTDTTNPHLDGFYRLGPVTLPGSWLGDCVDALSSGAGKVGVPFSIGADPVAGYAAAMFETAFVTGIRTNAHSWTTTHAAPVLGVPRAPDNSGGLWGTPSGGGVDSVRFGDGVRVQAHETADAVSETVEWWISPDSFYDGACTVQMDYGDGVWRDVVGTDPPNLADDWRIGNGLVRVTPVFTSNDMRLNVEHWDQDSGTWVTHPLILTTDANGPSWEPMAAEKRLGITVVENAPERVTVAITIDGVIGSAGPSPAHLYRVLLSLTRGHVMVAARFDDDAATSVGGKGVYINDGSTGTTTAQPAGVLRRDVADADGNLWVLVSPDSGLTIDTAKPGIRRSSATPESFRFGFGLQVANGSTIPSHGNPRGEYIGVISARARAVQR